jgi:hypothetical protein
VSTRTTFAFEIQPVVKTRKMMYWHHIPTCTSFYFKATLLTESARLPQAMSLWMKTRVRFQDDVMLEERNNKMGGSLDGTGKKRQNCPTQPVYVGKMMSCWSRETRSSDGTGKKIQNRPIQIDQRPERKCCLGGGKQQNGQIIGWCRQEMTKLTDTLLAKGISILVVSVS